MMNKWFNAMRDCHWCSNSWDNWSSVDSRYNWGMVSNYRCSMKSMDSWGMMSYNWSCVDSMDSWGNNWSMNSVDSWSMMSNNWGSMNSMVSQWSSMDSMMNWGMVGNYRCCVDSMMRMSNWSWDWVDRVNSVVGSMVNWLRDRLAILIKMGLGEEWVEERISIESIQFWSSVAVNSVPCLTSEQMLIKESSIGTNKPSTMWTMTAVLTDTVSLTTRVNISIHSWLEWG